MLMRLSVTGAVLLAIAGCDRAQLIAAGGACAEALRSLPKNPSAAARKALEAGDMRLIAINGYARSTPGVVDPRLREKHGLIVLEKTSDTPVDGSCERYQDAARVYANEYNRLVLQLRPPEP